MSTLAENAHFSHYVILSKLGAGGMGEVYLARDVELERRVALKILPSDLEGDEENIRRFIREAKSASALNHPNILTIYEVGRSEGLRYIATEYVHGQTLRQRLRTGTPPSEEILDISIQIAAALNAAHEHGIVHRDIKPENIMIRDDGLVKILDFGLAKLHRIGPPLADVDAVTQVQINTERGTVMGTAQYLSPEQARGKEVDSRTDIWSLGVIIHEMIAGKRPFDGESTADVLASILKTEPEKIGDDLQPIVEKALKKNADERYRSAGQLLRDLKSLRGDIIHASIPSDGPIRRVGDETAPTIRIEAKQIPTLKNTQVSDEIGIDTGNTPASGWGKRWAILAILVLVLGAVATAGYYMLRPASSLNSIAVLPFQNGSGDQNLDYLSDGISESIIDRLTLLPNLRVIARTSSFGFRGQHDVAAAAKALGVRAVVTGRVIQRGDQLAVRVELVDAHENRQLWSQVFNRSAAEAQLVQEEISLGIAERLRTLEPTIGPSQMTTRDLVKPRAFENLLRARFALRQYTPESTLKAIELYQLAINEEPGYGDAYAEIAYAYRVLAGNAFGDPAESIPKARAAAERALQINNDLALAHLVIGEIERDNWNWAAAEGQYRQANELSPNMTEGHEAYAIYLSVLSRHDAAIAEMKRAVELDPLRLHTQVTLGAAYYNARRYDDAIAALQQALAIDRNAPVAHAWLGIVYAARGSHRDAIASFARAKELGDTTTSTRCYYGYSLARNGNVAEARAVLDQMKSSGEFVSPVGLAVLYTGLGEHPAALDSLEAAFRNRDPQLQYLNVEPHFDALRGDPRFQSLVVQVGLSK
ncbi:MAG TPA: protein kinase [Pyrinomonadaceae bacterium]|nr:protein kinase [Pyrinomonadaceae bacterium]